MGFEMVARLSCEANHQNSCITKHILHHSNPTIQKPRGKCHARPHASHPVTSGHLLRWFVFYGVGVGSHKVMTGQEGESPLLLKESF